MLPMDTGFPGHWHEMLTPPSLPSLTPWLAAEKMRFLSPLPSLHARHLPTFAVAFAT